MGGSTERYVRVCPVCEAENAPALARCACGASLASVDFSLARAAAAAPAGEPAPSPPPALEPAAAPASAAPAVVCPHPDCAQPNPPGSSRCVYCNRPLAAAPAAASGARPLPTALRDDYRVVEAFTAAGAEADLLLVEQVRGGGQCVVKLYRRGLEPDFRLLEILAQAVGDSVVRVLGHGISDGVAYEVLEYIPGGTLQDLLRSGPVGTADVRRIVEEIAAALNGIHAHRILHRDLKPENVLVRAKSPLELALTDFGIASLTAATQHFTSGARTTRYAAPEALTGVIDEKSDWWSLGMIALEAASGRHPFEGLSEQVMNHHLATRPIDVRSVYDDGLRRLCRGLLLRDPKRRWGAAEVARWLAGDTALDAPEDREGAASVVRPYRIGTAEATTAAELALAAAKHWQLAAKDLARGQLARWIEHELNDYDLLRKLRDIEEQRDLGADARLLRFLLAAAPDLPPIWQGVAVSRAAILMAARRAAGADDDARTWLDTLYRERVLAQFAAAGDRDLGDIDRCWREAWQQFTALWQAGRNAEETWRKQPRAVAGLASAEVVSFDDLVFTQAARLALPPQQAVNGGLLLARLDPEYAEAVRGEVIGALAQIAARCPWIEALWQQAQGDAIGVLVVQRMLPRARDDAELEARRHAQSQDARARIVGEAADELRARVAELIAIAPDEDYELDRETVARLLEAMVPFQQACQKAAALGYTEPDCVALRQSAEKLSSFGSALHHALARCEQVHGVNAIFMRPERWLMGLGLVAAAFVFVRNPWLLLVLLGAALAWGGYRWALSFNATGDALAKLGLLRRHARVFLRSAREAG